MKKSAVYLARAAVIAALYAVLTVLTSSFSYGQIQFRIAECLCILAFFYDEAVAGLTVGCLIANIFSPVGPLDIILGTLATLVSSLLSRLVFKAIKNRVIAFILCALFPIIVNALVVPIAILVYSQEEMSYFVIALQVGAGQAAVILTLGTALYAVMLKLIANGRISDGSIRGKKQKNEEY